MKKDMTLALSDGRQLGYNEYGDLKGFPIFAFHGLPGSRIWFIDDDKASFSIGIRLITVDRPGFGISTQKPNRTFLQFCDDIYELSQALSISKFSVMGISGGGVYAAACAYQFPDLIHKAGLISTVNQFENGKPPKDMAFVNRSFFILSRRFPWLLKFILSQQKKLLDHHPEKYLQSSDTNTKHLCESDREIMKKKEVAKGMFYHVREAYKNGVSGTLYEGKLFTDKWGFDPGRIEVPVEIWHGTEDTLAPIISIYRLADKIPNCNKNYIFGKGHFLAEDDDVWENILTSLK